MQLSKYKVLDNEEILKIHEVSLNILSDVGIAIHSREVLELLAEAGCEVDFKKNIAKIPKKIVEETSAEEKAKKNLNIEDKDKG